MSNLGTHWLVWLISIWRRCQQFWAYTEASKDLFQDFLFRKSFMNAGKLEKDDEKKNQCQTIADGFLDCISARHTSFNLYKNCSLAYILGSSSPKLCRFGIFVLRYLFMEINDKVATQAVTTIITTQVIKSTMSEIPKVLTLNCVVVLWYWCAGVCFCCNCLWELSFTDSSQWGWKEQS